MGREAQGNTGHKRCKYCGIDNWHHATLDCPGIGPPLPGNQPTHGYMYVSNTSKLSINSQYGKVKTVDNTVALWCSAGEHAFSAGDQKKEIFTRNREVDGDYIEEKYAICGKHANGLFGNAVKGEVS